MSVTNTKITLELTPEGWRSLCDLAEHRGGDVIDVCRIAISLYKAAWDCHRQGMTIGSAKKVESLDVEFARLWPEPEGQAKERDPEQIAKDMFRPEGELGKHFPWHLVAGKMVEDLQRVIAQAIRDDRQRQENEKDPSRDR